MRNHFDMNRAIASAHVFAEQCKGLLLAWAKILLVITSGCLVFMGFVMTFTDVRFVWSIKTLQALGASAPIAMVGFLFAVCIEAGTLASVAIYKEAARMRKIELDKYERVKHSYPTEKMQQERKQAIEKIGRGSFSIMVICVTFSVLAAEIFWQKAFENQGLYFHLAGIPLGLVCSTLLLFFEWNEKQIQQSIESVIMSPALIQIAMNESAKAKIFSKLFREQDNLLKDGQGFNGIIRESAKLHLIGAATEAIEQAGLTVTAEQLQRNVNDEQEAIAAADATLTGAPEPLPLQRRIGFNSGGRNTEQRKKVVELVRRYGAARVLSDPDKYAAEAGVSPITIKRWANK